LKLDRSSAEISIGRPIGNIQMYILDEHLNPVPAGVPGEIYIGGVGLARGYFKSPELTTRQFVSHPFSQDPKARLYKTGDWARYRPDGNIELVGRMDEQVKIAGFRVDLGEIETTLRQHPSIRDAMVQARDDAPGRRRLVAYVAAHKGAVPTASELTGFLRALLPYYMVPSSFIFIKHPSMSPDGTIDRRACVALDQDSIELKDGFVAPRTANEKIIANIWAETLNLKQIGVFDNFFDLGNHSTLAIQLINRIRSVFAVDLSVRALFEVPTVAGMTAAVVRKQYGWQIENGNGKLSSQLALQPIEKPQKPLYRS
jgi:hypothetical protein